MPTQAHLAPEPWPVSVCLAARLAPPQGCCDLLNAPVRGTNPLPPTLQQQLFIGATFQCHALGHLEDHGTLGGGILYFALLYLTLPYLTLPYFVRAGGGAMFLELQKL